MNYYALSSLVNFVTSISLCLAILSKREKTKIDYFFIFFALSAALWSAGYFFWQSSDDYFSALIWSKFFMVGATLIAISYVHFIFEFLGLSTQRRKFLIVSDLLFLVFGVLDLTPLIVAGLRPELRFQFWPIPGLAFGYFLFFWGTYIVYTTYLLYKNYRLSDGIRKKQIQFLFLGVAIGFISGSFNFFLWYGIPVLPVTNILVCFYVVCVFYAIIKYKFFNIKVIATELFVFFLVLGSVYQFFLGSSATQNIYFASSFIILTVTLGIFLIRSVLSEVQQREQLEDLSTQLTRANDQLKKLDEAKSEFLSVASHQLRTPLTAIKGYVSMLAEGDFGKLTPQQDDVLKILFDSSQRLVELIADLLDLSRIESGTMEFNFEAVDLCKIVDGVIDEVRPKTEAHNLYLFFDNVNRSCPMIRADAEKMRQVVINLIDNAVKYTVTGGVTVRLQRVGDKLRFSVSDTGIGIDPADQGKLFQKFFRAEAANEITREGTGLGIYVVQKLVKAQGGEIWFESPGVNKGTTFYISFNIPEGAIKPERIKVDSLF